MYLEMYNLTGKVAVVTGGGQGIGVACAESLAEAGAHVVIADLTDERAENGVQILKAKGFQVSKIAVDVSDSAAVDAAAVDAAAAGVMAKHGRIDILIVNAGVVGTGKVASVEIEDAEWMHIMNVNLNGAFWCCRAFGKYMVEAGTGAIVTMGSMSGIISNKPQIQPHYNASKAAVHHMTKSLAAEWGALGVRINSVAPTYIDTPINAEGKLKSEWYDVWMDSTPMDRMGQPSEIASAVLFLASDAASLVTGAVLSVDGGYTSW